MPPSASKKKNEQHVHNQLTTDKSIDQLHLLAQKLAQIDRRAALQRWSVQQAVPTKIWIICYHQHINECRDVRCRNYWRRTGWQQRGNLTRENGPAGNRV